MTGISFGTSFLLLQQEGFLIHSCFATGLTALRNAHVGDKGPYYTAFFQISIGFERLLKTIVILDHMARHNLAPAPPGLLKQLGHKLVPIFEEVRGIQTSRTPHPFDAVRPGGLEYEILNHLSSFANGARYFNLDTLASGSTATDPLTVWGRILWRILQEDVPSKVRARVSFEASAVAEALRGHAQFIVHGLDRVPLTPQEALEVPALSYAAGRYAVWRVTQLLEPARLLLLDLTDRVMQLDHGRGASTPSVPFMGEYVQFLWLDKATILRKKRWP